MSMMATNEAETLIRNSSIPNHYGVRRNSSVPQSETTWQPIFGNQYPGQ